MWPSDAIWRHRSRPALARVMACCLTAPSHYRHEPMLIHHQWGSVALNWDEICNKCANINPWKWVWKLRFYNYSHISPWSTFLCAWRWLIAIIMSSNIKKVVDLEYSVNFCFSKSTLWQVRVCSKDARNCSQRAIMAIVEDNRGCFELIDLLYLIYERGIKTKKHFEMFFDTDLHFVSWT